VVTGVDGGLSYAVQQAVARDAESAEAPPTAGAPAAAAPAAAEPAPMPERTPEPESESER
jgi:hypothetical protein